MDSSFFHLPKFGFYSNFHFKPLCIPERNLVSYIHSRSVGGDYGYMCDPNGIGLCPMDLKLAMLLEDWK